MSINQTTRIQTYKWRNGVNKLPFNWKCQSCGTITEILSADTTKEYECSNEKCPVKLKFVLLGF